MRPEHDVVVLAGGAARRLGGTSKPDVVVAGRRLIERSLDAAAHARRIVVVGPPEVAPPGVATTWEEPPGGGPVAGLAAGLGALPGGCALVLVLACDVPSAHRVVDPLFAALAEHGQADGAAVVDTDGRRQPLVALYRRDALERAMGRLAEAGGVRDAAVRRLVERLRLADVPDPGGHALDVDTWADVARAAAEVARAEPEVGPVTPPR